MGQPTRYSSIQSQLQQLTKVVNDVLGTPRDFSRAYYDQATLEELVLDLETVYSSTRTLLKSHYNQLSPINKLPDELLLIIFTYAFNDQTKRRMFQYTPLTWICRRWRSLALDCAELWTCLDLSCENYYLIQEWLVRSKMAKLSVGQGSSEFVDYNAVGHEIQMLEQLIAPQLWRVESLSLKMNARRFKEICPFLQQEAPSLKHLHLSHAVEVISWIPSHMHMTQTTNPSIKFPRILNGVASLHSLTFDMPLTPPWNDFIPLMQNLRELRVVTIPQDSDHKCSARSRLLSILPSCPFLEVLDFRTASDGETVMAPRMSISSVSMPKLWQLTIQSSQDVGILSHIDAPCLRHLTLHLDKKASDSLVEPVSNLFDLASLKEVAIDSDGVSLTSEEGEHTPPCFNSRRKLLSLISSKLDDLKSLTSALLSNSPNISCLVLFRCAYGDPRPSLQTFKQIVLDAKSVTHLVIAWSSETLTLLKMFEDPLLCPVLVKMSCVGCESAAICLSQKLLDCVRERRDSPLKEIYTMHCPPLDEFFLKRMEELGVQATWKL